MPMPPIDGFAPIDGEEFCAHTIELEARIATESAVCSEGGGAYFFDHMLCGGFCCMSSSLESLGDGVCDEVNNTQDCLWDAWDCSPQIMY